MSAHNIKFTINKKILLNIFLELSEDSQGLKNMFELAMVNPSRKHAYIILTPLNPTFI